ncbi:hypothetical protein OsccyDRAFT_0686 [Leptolyngbyaceae cyanobacterium JSC-12]|nr:hypothetical protein OsccyDRAFT_0686 [Leptolyngbyaceae cyanobacterium JSC-12]
MTFNNVRTVTSSTGNPVNAVYGAAVNNAILDPLQGYDADVWVLDQATGRYLLVGRFTSIQITVRNATEPYMEFNQRVPRYLDGEIQIGWVLERGMLDTRILQQTFGISALTRELRLNRMARFQITFELNAEELHNVNQSTDGNRNSLPPDYNESAGIIGNGELFINRGPSEWNPRRSAKGQLMLTYCKVDSFTLGAMAGRSVIANRWEGLAEGIEEVNRTSIWAGIALNASSAANNLPVANNANPADGVNLGRPSGVIL